MLTVEEARKKTLEAVTPLEAQEIALDEAAGRVLREDVQAVADAPAADNSAMDGYAVRAIDAREGAILQVIGEVRAGDVPDRPLEPGTAIRIMTGASIPAGADAVIQVEWTDGGIDSVRIDRAVEPGQNIRRRGEDMRRGDPLLSSGTRIGPAGIALLAAARRSVVRVGRRPVVAILSTGNELTDVAEPERPGSIVNTNGPLLAALVRGAGGIPKPLGIVRDDLDATIGALREAAGADVILSSGGVSVGAWDFVKAALERLGAETTFWRVAMKPGKPLVVARLHEHLFMGLPGNPASCFVAFHLFVAPALGHAMGLRDVVPPQLLARITAPLKSAGDRRLYARVRLVARDGELVAEPLATQGSGSLTSMRGANGLAVVESGTTAVAAGERVPVVVIGELR